MKLIIDIPEDEYSWLIEHPNSIRWSSVYTDSILNGVPLDDIATEIEDVIKRYKGSCDQELGIKWGYEGALEIINEHIGKENHANNSRENTTT